MKPFLLFLTLLPLPGLAQNPPVPANVPEPLPAARLIDPGAEPPSKGAPGPLLPPLAPAEILDSKTYDLGDHRITLQEVSPAAFPAIKPPAPPLPSPPRPPSPEFLAKLAERRAVQARTRRVHLDAIVYHGSELAGQVRTRFTLWMTEGKQPIVFWSSLNANYLGGLSGFQGADGQLYSGLFMAANTDLDQWRENCAKHGQPFHPPQIPVLPPDKTAFSIIEGDPAAGELASIQALHDFYNTGFAKLKADFETRELERRKQEAELLANPPGLRTPPSATACSRTRRPKLCPGPDAPPLKFPTLFHPCLFFLFRPG